MDKHQTTNERGDVKKFTVALLSTNSILCCDDVCKRMQVEISLGARCSGMCVERQVSGLSGVYV